MENQVTIFSNEEFGNVRAVMINNNPYFCAKDVATALGYANYMAAVKRHCNGVVKHRVLTEGGNQEMSFISGCNVCRLTMRSKLPSAEKFENWVLDEVIPQIRKHDAYMTENTIEKEITSLDFLIQLATKLKEEQEARKKAEAIIEEQKPLVSFANRVAESSDCLDMEEFSEVIKDENINMEINKLFQWLRDNKYLMDNNVPYQDFIDNGLFKVIEVTKKSAYDNGKIYTKTLVTGKGQIYILKKLKEECA